MSVHNSLINELGNVDQMIVLHKKHTQLISVQNKFIVNIKNTHKL